jgi:hypothetical protein
MRAFKHGESIGSPVSGEMYRVTDLLGRGGFGSAYGLSRPDKKGLPVEELCLKSTLDSQSWHQEAYFGELMRSCDRAIRMHEAFPLFPPTKRHDVIYSGPQKLDSSGHLNMLSISPSQPARFPAR